MGEGLQGFKGRKGPLGEQGFPYTIRPESPDTNLQGTTLPYISHPPAIDLGLERKNLCLYHPPFLVSHFLHPSLGSQKNIVGFSCPG